MLAQDELSTGVQLTEAAIRIVCKTEPRDSGETLCGDGLAEEYPKQNNETCKPVIPPRKTPNPRFEVLEVVPAAEHWASVEPQQARLTRNTVELEMVEPRNSGENHIATLKYLEQSKIPAIRN